MNLVQQFAVDFIVFALLSAIMVYGVMQLAFPPVEEEEDDE
jgi:phage shock protein PspC (stress-responsive transcriptional regulator)|tara:strand:- start:1638 stop:1760 length:123 start_codon:yes stop_codon:yes gene_type:complete